MKIRPAGHKILVKPEKVQETSKGGIIIPEETKRMEQNAQVRAEVIAVGLNAYEEYDEPWCKVGDTILYQRYSGMKVLDKEGKATDYLLLNDLDVSATVED